LNTNEDQQKKVNITLKLIRELNICFEQKINNFIIKKSKIHSNTLIFNAIEKFTTNFFIKIISFILPKLSDDKERIIFLKDTLETITNDINMNISIIEMNDKRKLND
jgi:hypothetical protein